jgi:DNA modification methylase
MKLKDYEYYRTDLGVLYCGDCLEILPLIDEKVDLVLTDPPYNASHKKIEFKEKKYFSINEKWDKDFKIDFINILKANQLLVFCSHHTIFDYPKNVQQILHWEKINPFPAISKVYTFSIEYILWYVNSHPYTFNKTGLKDVFKYSFCNGSEREKHPAQKPIKLIQQLIKTHSKENDLILDCFIGSGTTAVACEKLNRRWIGIEISEKYCDIAKQRIKAEADQFKMEFNK